MLAAHPTRRIVEASTNFLPALAPCGRSAYGRRVDVALLDRDAELDALERTLGAVRAGAGRVVAVEGAAGIGKSSLLRAAGRTAEARGIVVLRARGGPLEHQQPRPAHDEPHARHRRLT
jgi:hypothetical protein